jgi:hypothetical protein
MENVCFTVTYKAATFLMYRAFVPDVPTKMFLMYRAFVPDVPTPGCS